MKQTQRPCHFALIVLLAFCAMFLSPRLALAESKADIRIRLRDAETNRIIESSAAEVCAAEIQRTNIGSTVTYESTDSSGNCWYKYTGTIHPKKNSMLDQN